MPTTPDDVIKARTRAGITQGQLAERIGVTPKTLRDFEKGVRDRLQDATSWAALEQFVAEHSGRAFGDLAADPATVAELVDRASDTDLLTALATRLAELREHGAKTPPPNETPPISTTLDPDQQRERYQVAGSDAKLYRPWSETLRSIYARWRDQPETDAHLVSQLRDIQEATGLTGAEWDNLRTEVVNTRAVELLAAIAALPPDPGHAHPTASPPHHGGREERGTM